MIRPSSRGAAGCVLALLLIGAPGVPTQAQTTAEQIEALLTRYHEAGLFNGAVLAAEGGSVVYRGGFGEADMAWRIPNTPDTKFRIASATKPFTAALVLALVEDGKIELDAPVTAYLPGYPAETGDRVTIHHLLSHTSGIPSYTSLPGFMTDAVRDPHTPDELVALFSGLDLEFEPGERWAWRSETGCWRFYSANRSRSRDHPSPFDPPLRNRPKPITPHEETVPPQCCASFSS